ncbi:MAG: site-2 protease family protein [Candidatus Bathyarchaeia archaeon]
MGRGVISKPVREDREVWRTDLNALSTLSVLVLAWLVFYFSAKALRLDRYGLDVRPLYALYKSTRLNASLERLGRRGPRLWRVIGNIGVAAAFGEVAFMTYLLFQNLMRFVYAPEQASPVVPLIPGVTVRLQSLPWFLAAAGIVILTHELAHGVQCAVEGVPIRYSALLLAVVTFGGAVEPDDEAMEAAETMSKMRIFAAGSLVNLVTGLLAILASALLYRYLPPSARIFLQWLYFISINLAMVNMLPVYPLDGGQMLNTYIASMRWRGRTLQRAAMYGFIALIASNVVLSLMRFGLIPL